MRIRAVIFLTIILSGRTYGQTSDTFPKIKDIVKEFYSNYNTDDFEYPYVAIEKRKEGWYIARQRRNNLQMEIIDKFLFYDNNSRKYSSLALRKNVAPKLIDPSIYLDDYTLRNYDVQIFYGYRGWYKDVINELSDKKYLSDDELNGLARAYSTYAAGMIFDQGDMLENEVWKLHLDINCLSLEQIKKYNSLEVNAQKLFKELASRNPKYETIVGTIAMKAANEVMVQYTTLLAYANDYAKKIKLPENLYTEEQLITAKQILQNSPLNAIFLSFGDNDYYPLYYLQSVKNLRKDVYVINYNLIGIDRYIYRATMPVNSALSIRLTADSNLYKEDTNNFILFEDSSNAIPFSDVIRLLKTGKKDYNGFITLKADKIVISEKKSNISTTKEIPMRGVQYIYKNQWILLDIINNLNGRKMCFLNEFADQLKGLNDHFIFDNGLYILE